jgi:hypothetical protein
MSNDTLKIGIDVSSNGTLPATTKEAATARKEFDALTKSAERANRASQGGGTSGSRKAAAAAMDSNGYKNLQGTAETSGASGRDFAKQARGVEGLVRVYAIFAANLFAVSAAFNALREAAATEAMVKGLDQLGAASGRSLGTLSKQLVKSVDGAISLRDAMTSVAQASSAGLNTTQIKDLAIVANKASQALGLNMADAMSRLSRGISKIEPELLDELGIFVKVDEASQKYALSVGKNVASLSDFEKRQAFANAVLDQAKEKFSALDIAANPYDKLLASVQNLATSGLELINTFLTPAARLLAESPSALGTVFAGIVYLLLKQAIPALGEFRKGLENTTKKAADAAGAFSKSFPDNFQDKLAERFKLPDLQKDVAKAESALNKLSKNAALDKSSVGVLAQASEADAKTLAKVNGILENRNKIIETGKKGAKDATAEQIAAAKADKAYIESTIDLYKKRIALSTAYDKAETFAGKPQGRFDPEVIALNKYAKLRKEVTKSELVAGAAENASILGVGQSWKLLNEQVKKEGLTGLDKYTTLAKGGFAAVTSRVMGIAGALGTVGQLIGLAVGVFTVFDSYASKATKEQEAFNSASEATSAAVKGINDSFDLYIKKKKDSFSLESIVAFTNALSGLTDAFDSQIIAIRKFDAAAGPWDTFKDSFSKFWGGDNASKLKQSAKETVSGVLKSLEFSSFKAQDESIIASTLGLDDPKLLYDTKALGKAIDDIPNAELLKKFDELKTKLKGIQEQEEYSTNAAKAFSESLANIGKLTDQMIQANAFTDLQGKMGVELVQASDKLAQALQDPLKALLELEKLSKDPKALAALGDSVDIGKLQEAARAVQEITKAEKALEEANKLVSEARAGKGALASAKNVNGIAGRTTEYTPEQLAAATRIDIKGAESVVKSTIEKLNTAKQKGAEFAESQISIVQKIAEAGLEKIEIGLKRTKELAAIEVTRNKLSFAATAGFDTSSAEYKLRTQELNIQAELIEASYKAQIETQKNTDTLAQLTAVEQLRLSQEKLKDPNIKADEKALAEIMEKAAIKSIGNLAAKDLLKQGMSEENVKIGLGGGEAADKAVLAAGASIRADSLAEKQRAGALAQINAQRQIAAFDRQTKADQYSLKVTLDKIAIDKNRLEIQSQLINTAEQLNSYSSIDLVNLKSANQEATLADDYKAKEVTLSKELADLNRAYSAAKRELSTENYLDLVDQNTQKAENLRFEKEAKQFALDINKIKEKGTVIQAELARSAGIEQEKLSLTNSIQEAKLAAAQKELDLKAQLGYIDELTLSRSKTQAELDQQKLKFSEQELRLTNELNAKKAAERTAQAAYNAAEKLAKANPTDATAQAAQGTASTALTNAKDDVALADKRVTTNTTLNDIAKESINLQGKLNEQLIKQAEHLERIQSVSESLAVVFGDTGKALGDTIGAFDKLNTNQEKRKQQLTETKLKGEELAVFQRKQALDEITDTANAIGATKKLFKEKTFAYKALEKTEKAMHLYRIASEAKELAIKINSAVMGTAAAGAGEVAKTGFTFAGFAARLPAYIAETFFSITGQLGIFGPAIAAGIVASILSKVGGGGSPASAGFAMNSEQRQETQGTGTTYNSQGNKVETGGGVFGESSSKVDNINKSLEIIKNNSIEGLSYDNQMLKAFEKLSNALTGAATAIYTIPGLRQGGTSFGTLAGTTKDAGTLGNIPIVGKLLGNIFGGGTSATSTIESAGIQLRGSLQQLIDDTTSSVLQYKDVLTQFHKDGGWFGSNKDWTTRSREVDAVKADVANSIKDIFVETKNMFTTIGKEAGVSASTVQNIFDTINFAGVAGDIDLKGLTGDEIVKALNAVIGSKLDEAAKTLFASFDQYKKFGESYLTTVVRVIDTNTKIQQILTNMGIDTVVSKVYDITEAMATAAGGLDKFIAQYDFFKSNFLTASEQLVPVQKAVTDELKRLNISTDINRKGFVSLIRSLDLTTITGQETYQALMNLAPGIDQVFKAEEKIADERAGLQKKILELEGNTIALREKELAALDASNQALQKQIYALETQQTAAKNLKSNLDNVTKTIKSQIQALSDYKSSLMTGASSTLTTSEQYQVSKSEITSLLEIINRTPKTKEEEDARNAAISKLSGTTDKFLGFSRQLFASGSQYTADFNTVLDIINQTSGALGTQLSTAEQQLNTLVTANTFLQSIDASSKTTAELLQEYIQANAALAATGYNKTPGFATGTNYVPNDMVAQIHKGERIIPTADNFKLMTRLNTTDNYTRDMCEQIRELNQKIVSLERTVAEGAVINAEATNRNTEQIAQAVTDSSGKTIQANRLQAKASIK